MYSQHQALHQANLTINIEALSPKQLLGECIDIACLMLKQLIIDFTMKNQIEYPFENQKVDYSTCANFILEQNRMEKMLDQYVKTNDKSHKSLAKSWFFELKYLRNCWAHSQVINKRLAMRGFDTLALLFEILSGDTTSEMYQRIEGYRKTLMIAEAKSYVS